MKTSHLTKIVSLCLFAALCGCSQAKRPYAPATGVGAHSKAGTMLTASVWCKGPIVDDQGQARLEKLTFSPDGKLVFSLHILRSDSSMKLESLSEATWAVLDGALAVMQETRPSKTFMLSPAVRDTDGASCVNLTPASDTSAKTEQICPCE